MKDDMEIIEDMLSKFLAGEASPEEAMMVEEWAAKSDANRAFLDNCYRIFDLPDKIHSQSDNQLAWGKIVRDIEKYESSKWVRAKGWYIGIAASTILLIFIGALINYLHQNTHDLVYYANTYAKKLQLNDASEITLGPSSTLTVNKGFGKSNRQLKLTGSAFFSVRHNNTMPLIIDMNGFYVQDLGTRFTIGASANADTIYISVEEGKVSAYDAFGSKIIINAPEKALYIKSSRKLAMSGNHRVTSKLPGVTSDPQNTGLGNVHKTPGGFLPDTTKAKLSQNSEYNQPELSVKALQAGNDKKERIANYFIDADCENCSVKDHPNTRIWVVTSKTYAANMSDEVTLRTKFREKLRKILNADSLLLNRIVFRYQSTEKAIVDSYLSRENKMMQRGYVVVKVDFNPDL